SQGQEPLLSEGHQHVLRALETVCEEVQTPLQRLEHALQHWVPFAILPLFVLTNAGIHLEGSVGQLISPVSLGVVLGLLIGKPVGILLSYRIASIGGWLRLPTGVTWCHLAGMAILAGIGFTMSLFVANLAFETAGEVVLLKQAKIGILVAALIAASGGALALQLEKVLCRVRRAETAAPLAETEGTH
ncbi:MAG: Na+/H+ antiporter NhaA, partial [Ktedonobacteraceae bacterium]|nr:Na+/H+ antiporter NhaA [Ktedonobacteraceae bacterium]